MFSVAAPALEVPGASLCSVSIGDMDGDNVPDVAAVDANSYAGRIAVASGRGNGQFNEAIMYSTGLSPGHLLTANLDSDDLEDIAVASGASMNVSIHRGGTFELARTLPAGPCPDILAAAHLDNDQSVDLISVSACGGAVSVYLNRSIPVFAPPVYVPEEYRRNSGVQLAVEIQLPASINSELDLESIRLLNGTATWGPQTRRWRAAAHLESYASFLMVPC